MVEMVHLEVQILLQQVEVLVNKLVVEHLVRDQGVDLVVLLELQTIVQDVVEEAVVQALLADSYS
jgi:hypothetical protein